MTSPYRRFDDWPARLNAFLTERRKTPFAWGVHDCCQFARRGVQALCGRDPGRGLGLRCYSTAGGAHRQLARLGGVDAIPARAGFAEIPLAFAGRGDVVECAGEDGAPALGLCCGAQSAFPGRTGLVFVDTLKCRKAWRVG